MNKIANLNKFTERAVHSLTEIVDELNTLPTIKLKTLNKENTVIVNMDMIEGFAKKGALYSDRIKEIIPYVVKINESFVDYIKIFFADTYSKQSVEFETYPEHGIPEMFDKYWEFYAQGNIDEANKYILNAVRPDTSGNMRDKSVPPLGDKKRDFGVNARLVWNLREAIDIAWKTWNGEDTFAEIQMHKKSIAQEWCNNVKISVTGGFNAEKIRDFEELGVPVDVYGVGSSLLENSDATNNDFTADIIRVKVENNYYPIAKVGRGVTYNQDLAPYEG